MRDRFDFDDDFYDEFDDDFDEEEWNEEKWEQFFKQEDEQQRRLQKLIDKYGFSEQGLRRAFEEMGYYVPDENELLGINDLEDEEENIDEILEHDFSDWSPENSSREQLQNAHPLFRDCYNLILKVMKMLKYIDVGYREHPIITFQNGLFECMSKLIRAGYDDIDFKLEAERGLILAALKRSRKALFMSVLTIPKLDAMKIISYTTQNFFRNKINDLLRRINQEIIHFKQES